MFVLAVGLWTMGKGGPDLVPALVLLGYSVPTIALGFLAGLEFGRPRSGPWVALALVAPAPILLLAPLLLIADDWSANDFGWRLPYRGPLLEPTVYLTWAVGVVHIVLALAFAIRAVFRFCVRAAATHSRPETRNRG